MRTSERHRLKLLVQDIGPGDTVLDVGAARHDRTRRRQASLHRRLVDTGAEVIGVDVLEGEVEAMQSEGYDVRVGDAETLDQLDVEPVDFVVAGEVIEHLSNPGKFLESSFNVTRESGTVLLSTPNPHAWVFTKKAVLGRQNNPEHTCWFDPQFLKQLSDRFGWTVCRVSYVQPDGGLSAILYRFSRTLGSPNFVAELEKI